jgi:purine-cytosine permease-like protein
MAIRIETTRPSTLIVVLSLIIVILAIVGHFTRIPYVTQYQFWVLVLGYVVLLFGALYGK